jgi:hypothetical protein
MAEISITEFAVVSTAAYRANRWEGNRVGTPAGSGGDGPDCVMDFTGDGFGCYRARTIEFLGPSSVDRAHNFRSERE